MGKGVGRWSTNKWLINLFLTDVLVTIKTAVSKSDDNVKNAFSHFSLFPDLEGG